MPHLASRYYAHSTRCYSTKTKAPRVTRAGTYGHGNAPLKGCILLLLILNSIHNSAADRRWAGFQSKTPLAGKPALLTTLSRSLSCDSTAEHCTAEQYYKPGRTKLQKDLRRSDRSWNTCQDFLIIKSLWAAASTVNRAEALLKGHLSIKGYPQYNKVSRLHQHSSI